MLGLSALVASVATIGTAGVAQAEAGACWSYLTSGVQKCFGEGGLEANPLFALENNTGTLLIENLNFEILCTGTEFDEGGQLAANGSILLGRLKFTGCIALSKSPLSELPACTPNDPATGLGTILTEKFTGLIVLHELSNDKVKDPVVLLKPDTGETLARLALSEECFAGEELIFKGELVLSELVETACGDEASFEEHKLSHLFEEFKALQLMTLGSNKATIDGSVNVTLGAPHNILEWGGKAA